MNGRGGVLRHHPGPAGARTWAGLAIRVMAGGPLASPRRPERLAMMTAGHRSRQRDAVLRGGGAGGARDELWNAGAGCLALHAGELRSVEPGGRHHRARSAGRGRGGGRARTLAARGHRQAGSAVGDGLLRPMHGRKARPRRPSPQATPPPPSPGSVTETR